MLTPGEVLLPEKHHGSAGVTARAGYIKGEEEDSPGGAEPAGEEWSRVLNRIRRQNAQHNRCCLP